MQTKHNIHDFLNTFTKTFEFMIFEKLKPEVETIVLNSKKIDESNFYKGPFYKSCLANRISVDDKKAEKLAGDLNSIFEFIEKLNKLDTKNIEPLTSVAETTLKFRNDEVKSKDIREQIIKNSPQDNEDYFVVPKVIE